MTEIRKPARIPITAVAVFGLGGLVALAVGVSLFLGLSSATENTRLLMQARVDGLLDSIEQRIHGRLRPVVEQGRWIRGQGERSFFVLGARHHDTLSFAERADASSDDSQSASF